MIATFPIGISSYALRWSIQLFRLSSAELLEKAAGWNLQVVQLCDNLALEDWPEADLTRLRVQSAALGLMLEFGATGCTPVHLRACVDTASALNARILRMVIRYGSGAINLAEVEQTIRGILPELRDRGITLALENHFDLSPQELALLIETIGAPEVGVCLDVFNSVYHLASQAETLACLAPYAHTVHVKDVGIRRQNSGFYVYGCRLGQGRMNLDDLLAALKAYGTTPALLIESWMDRLDSDCATREQEENWLQESISYLRLKTIEEIHP